MTSIFSDGALHPGRDPNDAVWMVLRRREDWATAAMNGIVFDPTRGALTLVPAPLDGNPSSELCDADGTCYRVDPDLDQVMRRTACGDWVRIVGGHGWESGKLDHPVGLALDARRGLLAIADSGNHRVQVVRADTGEPVVILGCSDAWGRGVASGPGALVEPVAIGFDRGFLAVADRAGGRIWIYDDRFEPVDHFAPVPPDAPLPFAPAPIAAVLAGCVVWVIDAGWSTPSAYGFDGKPVADAGDRPGALDAWDAFLRWQSSGTLELGPIDGQTEDLPWHRVIVDALAPAGCAIEIQTYASDDPTTPAVIPWAPAHPIAIPLTDVDASDGESDRPVLSDQGRWFRKRGEPYLRMAAPVVRLSGTGPINVAGFTVPWPAALRLRAGDAITLTAGALATPPLAIASISTRVVQAVTRGTMQLYGLGSTLTLIERDGAALLGGPRPIYQLAAGDKLDLSAALDDATLYDLPASHAVAALLRDGDLVSIAIGAVSATLAIGTVARDDATLALATPVVGDFSTADLRFVTGMDRLLVDALDWADDVPAGEQIVVIDDVAGTAVAASLRWAERDAGALWLEPGPPIPWDRWTRFTLPDPVATDRGRYIWLRMRLAGRIVHPGDGIALATPEVRAVRLLMPRPSYLRYLPAVYARRDDDDPSGALFLERFLALPERQLTTIEAEYEDVARELNPLAASADWLAFMASWFQLVFDPSWPIVRRRELLRSANELFAKRGTVQGLRRYLEIYTGAVPAIIEGFQWRGGAPPVLSGDAILGATALGTAVPAGGLAHHFSIWVFGDATPCAASVLERAARAIIESIKPAHTAYDLFLIDGMPRVGITTTVGVDMALIGGAPETPLGLDASTPAVLGATTLLPNRPRPTRLGPIPLDDDFTLT